MSPESESAVRASWAEIERNPDAFAGSFYARMFELDPSLQRLFAATDMTAQRRKFMAMLHDIVRAIDDPDHLVHEMAASGRRHLGYGVADRDFEVVGAALQHALATQLGARYTPALRDAWRELYTLVAALMRRAAALHAPARP